MVWYYLFLFLMNKTCLYHLNQLKHEIPRDVQGLH